MASPILDIKKAPLPSYCYRRSRSEKDAAGVDLSTFIYVSYGMVAGVASRIKASDVFHALSDPTRLELISRLSTGEQCVCELMDALKAGQSRLSFHLKVLKDAGLIQDRREGRWMYYALNENAFEEVEELIRTLKKGASLGQAASRRC